MYHSSTYALLLNANLNVGHPVNVDCCALKAVGKHKVNVSTPHYAAGVRQRPFWDKASRSWQLGKVPKENCRLRKVAILSISAPYSKESTDVLRCLRPHTFLIPLQCRSK